MYQDRMISLKCHGNIHIYVSPQVVCGVTWPVHFMWKCALCLFVVYFYRQSEGKISKCKQVKAKPWGTKSYKIIMSPHKTLSVLRLIRFFNENSSKLQIEMLSLNFKYRVYFAESWNGTAASDAFGGLHPAVFRTLVQTIQNVVTHLFF